MYKNRERREEMKKKKRRKKREGGLLFHKPYFFPPLSLIWRWRGAASLSQCECLSLPQPLATLDPTAAEQTDKRRATIAALLFFFHHHQFLLCVEKCAFAPSTVGYDLSCAELSSSLSLERDLPLLWKKRRFFSFHFISPLVFLTASLVLLTHRAILTRHDRQHWLLFIYFFLLLLILFIDPFWCERANSDVAFLQNSKS